MDQDVAPKAESPADRQSTRPHGHMTRRLSSRGPTPRRHRAAGDVASNADDDADHARDERMTRLVHIVLGLVIAALGAWLLYRSRTELAFRGSNGEPGPGYLPVLLTICLVGLGLALTAVWLFGAKARHGEAPTLSLRPGRWAARCWCGSRSSCARSSSNRSGFLARRRGLRACW